MKDTGIATEAIVLRRFDYSENSQIARLYTRSHGRVSVIAKGSKKPNPDLRGPIDVFCLAEVAFRPRKPEELAVLTRYRVATGFRGLRPRLERMVAAFYLVELLAEGTRDFDPDEAMFDHFRDALVALESATPAECDAVVAATELGYLRHAGIQPSLTSCAGCGAAPRAGAPVSLSPGRGGVVCARCLPPETPGLIRFTAGQLRTLAALAQAAPGSAHRISVLARDREALRRFLDRALEHVLEKELRSAPFLRRVW